MHSEGTGTAHGENLKRNKKSVGGDVDRNTKWKKGDIKRAEARKGRGRGAVIVGWEKDGSKKNAGVSKS